MTAAVCAILVLSPSMPARWWGFGTRVLHLVDFLARRARRHRRSTYAGSDEQAEVDHLRDRRRRRIASRAAPGRHRRLDQLRSLLDRQPFAVRSVHSGAAAHSTSCSPRQVDVVLVESSRDRLLPPPGRMTSSSTSTTSSTKPFGPDAGTASGPGCGASSTAWSSGSSASTTRLWRQVDAVAVTSDREVPDRAPCRRHAGRRRAQRRRPRVLPRRLRGRRRARSCFTGLLSYRPNLEAIQYFVDEVLPSCSGGIPDVVLTITGHGERRDLAPCAVPGVVVTGRVPDLRPAGRRRRGRRPAPHRRGHSAQGRRGDGDGEGDRVDEPRLRGIDVRDGDHLLRRHPRGLAEAISTLIEDRRGARGRPCGSVAAAVDAYSWDVAALASKH